MHTQWWLQVDQAKTQTFTVYNFISEYYSKLEKWKLNQFKHSNFKFDQTQAWLFVFKANSN